MKKAQKVLVTKKRKFKKLFTEISFFPLKGTLLFYNKELLGSKKHLFKSGKNSSPDPYTFSGSLLGVLGVESVK